MIHEMQPKVPATGIGGAGIFQNTTDPGICEHHRNCVYWPVQRRTVEIPFINVNFPNDGGVTGNPEFVILNTTLRAHCEALYKFIQRNWATSNIFYVRRSQPGR